MLAVLLVFSSAASVAVAAYAGEVNAGEVKQVRDMKVLAVERKESHPNIASVFADLVDYYNNGNLEEIEAMKIIFPQMGISFRNGDRWIAIEFQGEAIGSDTVAIQKLSGGRFYSTEYIGPYQHLNAVIDDAFESLIVAGYRADTDKPLRLLYWNSPDDNPPHRLRTEIQIPLL